MRQPRNVENAEDVALPTSPALLTVYLQGDIVGVDVKAAHSTRHTGEAAMPEKVDGDNHDPSTEIGWTGQLRARSHQLLGVGNKLGSNISG